LKSSSINPVVAALAAGCLLALGSLAQANDWPVDATTGHAAPPAQGQPSQGDFGNRGIGPVLLDDFNRADGPLGPDWTVHNGSCAIDSNAATCSSAGLATMAAADGSDALSIDVEAGAVVDTKYAALVQGYGGGSNNLFIKVQAQSGNSSFTNAACYTGNNGASFGLGFFDLDATFDTATMTVTRVGDDVFVDFTNIDGGMQSDQNYVCSNAPAPDGTGAGIAGFSGLARMDNFSGQGEPPAPAAPALAVPVDSMAGLLALMLLLAGTGVWLLRQR
jgi:hypothetical protein